MLEQAALDSSALSNAAISVTAPVETAQFESAHLERDRLQELSDGCLDFEHELLTMFLKDSQQHLDQLRQAIAQQNQAQVYHHAHHLKGSSANIGAKRIRAIAHELETQSHPTQTQPLFEQWHDDLAELEFSWQQIQKIVWAQYPGFADR
jgi:HPt (histidine-containing phosphotransfer) domain-containing protein